MFYKLKKIYFNEQFNPKVIGLFINPSYFARKGLYDNLTELIPLLSGKLLDIGCGTKPYENISNVDEYVGLEIDDEGERLHSFADLFYDGKKIPCKDKEFDSILSNQVFEHVFNPNEFLEEINRVTKIGGQLLISAPFIWDEHEQPYDYARYTSFGLHHILSVHGFEVVLIKKVNSGTNVIFQLLASYLYKLLETKNVYANLLIAFVFISPINILGKILSFIFPSTEDIYLDNVVLAKKIKDL